MKNKISIIAFLSISFLTPATGQSDSLVQVINQEVWVPFMKSYAAFDAEAFMAVHAEDVIRVSHGKWANIRVGESYAQSMQQNARRGKEQNRKRSISFVFNERTYGDDHGWETGYYKVISQTGEEPTRESYGEFTVVLKKEDGSWKILVDSDVDADEEKAKVLFAGEGVLRM